MVISEDDLVLNRARHEVSGRAVFRMVPPGFKDLCTALTGNSPFCLVKLLERCLGRGLSV